MSVKTRVRDSYIEQLIKFEGQLSTGPINDIGILRLALDLKDARDKIKALEEEKK